MPDLKHILRESKQDLLVKRGRVKVFVELQEGAPDAQCLDHLHELGLTVDRVIKNKIVGSIEARFLAALEADPAVKATEVSAQLAPHA